MKKNRILISWVGSVLDISDDTFSARLINQKTKDEEFVEIYKKTISANDLKFLQLGASFFWYIFKSNNQTKQLLRFCPQIKIQKSQIEKAKKEANAICKAFGW